MKRLLILVLMYSFSYNLFSIDPSLKLYIDVSSKFQGQEIMDSGVYQFNETKIWTPYFGGEKLKESEFFELTGYHNEAAICKKRESKQFKWGLTGLIMTTASLIGFVYPITFEDQNHNLANDTRILSCIPFTLGIGILSSVALSSGNKYHAQYAIDIAEQYNTLGDQK